MEVKRKWKNVILGGDFNAKSPAWGYPNQNDRGASLLEWVVVNELVVSNKGNTPTFQRGASSSFLDITMAGAGVCSTIENWEALDEETLSLHRYISFKVRHRGVVNRTGERNRGVWRALRL